MTPNVGQEHHGPDDYTCGDRLVNTLHAIATPFGDEEKIVVVIGFEPHRIHLEHQDIAQPYRLISQRISKLLAVPGHRNDLHRTRVDVPEALADEAR